MSKNQGTCYLKLVIVKNLKADKCSKGKRGYMDSRIILCIAVLFALSSVLFFSSPSITGRAYDIPTERVVVILKPELPSNGITGASVVESIDSAELRQVSAAVKEEVLEDVNSPGFIEGALGIGPTGDVQPERELESLPMMVVIATDEGVEKLKDHHLVEAVYDDIQFSLALAESSPLINATFVNSISINGTSLTGQGIAACVIDTGIQASHPAFGGRVVAQKCYCSSGCCPNGLAEDEVAADTHPSTHGTHVSGIIGANGTYVGVAPGSDIVAVKVCTTTCALSDIVAGIDFCVDHKEDYNIKVISGSIGDGGNYVNQSACPTYFDAGIDAAYSAGIASVFASGNNGYASGVSYPACSPNAISVGATDKSDVLASFSNRGSLLEVLAPGVSITSTKFTSSYGALTGTSQATPHVSGAVVLLQQYAALTNQTLTPDDIKEALVATGKNVSGYPRINILSALEYLGYSSSTQLVVSILSPADNTTVDTGNVSLVANVSGNETPVGIVWTSNVSGILGTGDSVLANLSPGAHLITAEAVEGNETASDSVSVTVNSPPDAPLSINIASPANDSTVYANGTVLSAVVSGNNSDNFTVVWTSNVSGILGEGISLSAILPVGSHTISATVAEANESASASISLSVIYPPITVVVNISSPPSNATLLTNGTSLTASSSPDGSIIWSSNISGILGAGASISVNLSAGLHRITAVSTVNGSSGNASINVNVISSPCVANIDLNNNTNSDIGDMVLLYAAMNTNSTHCIVPSEGECVVDLDQDNNNIYNSADIIELMRNIILGIVQDVFGASC
jgi:subtilisin family serine protease